MSNKKLTPLPFLLIVGFSLIVMLAVVIAQYHSQNGIRQLRNGNAQALITFEVDNLLDEIINETYVLEEETRKFIATGNKDQFKNIQGAIQKLQKETIAIDQLKIQDDSSRQIITTLTALVKKKMLPYQSVQLNTADTIKKNFLTVINAEPAKQLTDSIYVTALKIQIALGKNLESTIVKNESLSATVLSFSWILGFISITAIAILASIVIRRLLQNFKLIKALENAKTQAEKASLVKEQFLANMSHEIRTPVNSVLGFTNLLEKTEMKENQAQFIGLIKTAGQNLLNIINDILDLSKIESGMLHLDKNPFDLSEICQAVEMMFYHQLVEKQLTFNCNIDDNVPAVVNADKERLYQILMNLVNNAIKFTSAGEISLHVSLINKTTEKARLKFSVKDTGIGIKADKLDAIFERFEQAEASTTRKYGGTGLGLSIVKNLVNMQGGSIIAKSEYGHGAEFIFDIEVEIGDEATFRKEERFATPSTQRPYKSLDGIKVLAAEDNRMNQKLLQYIFDGWGLKYEFAETGKECIEKLQQSHADIVLMDIQMPEMDGYEAADKIRTQLKLTVPIIAMTANVLPGEKEKCKKIGINDYISKPLNEQVLYDLISRNLPSSDEEGKQQNSSLVNMPYLSKTFSGNTDFIKTILEEFSVQYPAELDGLQQAIDDKNISLVKSRSHHLKTTISTVNVHSPLLSHLERMEHATDTASDWEMIRHKMEILTSSRADLINDRSI